MLRVDPRYARSFTWNDRVPYKGYMNQQVTSDNDMSIDNPIEEAKDRLAALEQRLFNTEIRMETLMGQFSEQIEYLADRLSRHVRAGYHG